MIRLITILLSFSLLPGLAHAEKDTLLICYENTSNPPLYYSKEQAKPSMPGVTIELLRAAAEQNALQLKLIQIPWKRCLKAMQKNTVDGAFDLSYKAEREDFAVYPYAEGKVDQQRYLHELAYYLYTMKRSAVTWDGEKIHNLSGPIAGVSGYSIIAVLRADGYTVEGGRNQLSNMQMLIRGRVDGVAQFAATTQNIINGSPKLYRNVQKHDKPLRSKLYYLAFSKSFYDEHKNLAEQVWDSLATLNSQGFSEQLRQKYIQ